MGGLCFVAVYKPAAALPRVPDAAGLDGGAGREPSGFDHVTELFDEAGGEVYNLSRAGHIGQFFGGGPGFLLRGFGNLEDYRVVDTYVLGVGVEPAPLSTQVVVRARGFFLYTPLPNPHRCAVRCVGGHFFDVGEVGVGQARLAGQDFHIGGRARART
jgi:hypothetical protein